MCVVQRQGRELRFVVSARPSRLPGPFLTRGRAEYIKELVAAAVRAGGSWGVYTSPWEWRGVAGDSCTSGSTLPLWYAHYDNETTFQDFSKIGGWTKPAIKQYSGSGHVCGREVDLDFYP